MTPLHRPETVETGQSAQMTKNSYYDCDDNVFLRDVCKELNLSRRRYAALIGAYPDTVDSWFSGRHRPPKAVILLIIVTQGEYASLFPTEMPDVSSQVRGTEDKALEK